MQTQKTCRQLFNEFKGRYTIDEVKAHKQLQLVYDFLSNRCTLVNGNYYPKPSPYIADLLNKFLNWEQKKPSTEAEGLTLNNMQQTVASIEDKGTTIHLYSASTSYQPTNL